MTIGELVDLLGDNYIVDYYDGREGGIIYYEDRNILIGLGSYLGSYYERPGEDYVARSRDNQVAFIEYSGEEELLPGFKRDTLPHMTAQLESLGIEYEITGEYDEFYGEVALRFEYQGLRYFCSWYAIYEPETSACPYILFSLP